MIGTLDEMMHNFLKRKKEKGKHIWVPGPNRKISSYKMCHILYQAGKEEGKQFNWQKEVKRSAHVCRIFYKN